MKKILKFIPLLFLSVSCFASDNPCSPANGCTGVNNGFNTITTAGNLNFGGSLTFSGAYSSTITMTGATAITLPTSGTLISDAGSYSDPSWITSLNGSKLTGTVNATNSTNAATVSTATNASFFPLFAASSSNGNQAFNLGTGLSFNPSTNNLSTTTFTGALSGNATSASSATSISTAQSSTNASFFPLFVSSSTNGNHGVNLGTGLTFNPSTNNMTTTTFTGALSGNATTATTATNATNIGTTNVSTASTFYVPFVASSSSGNQAADISTALNYFPSTGNLSATTFTGIATNATAISSSASTTNATYYPFLFPTNTTAYQAGVTSAGLTYNPSTNLLTLSGQEQVANLNSVNFYSGAFSTRVGQVGPTATSGKTDMGMYSTSNGNWLRLGSNNANIAFFVKNQVAVSDSYDAIIDPSGNLQLSDAGASIYVKSGTNACIGTVTLSGATSTVNTSCAKTNDLIFLTRTVAGGTVGTYSYTISNGVSFTITSSTGSLDTSTLGYWIVHPN